MTEYYHRDDEYVCGTCCYRKGFRGAQDAVTCGCHQSDHYQHLVDYYHPPCGWWGKDKDQGPGHYYGKYVKP